MTYSPCLVRDLVNSILTEKFKYERNNRVPSTREEQKALELEDIYERDALPRIPMKTTNLEIQDPWEEPEQQDSLGDYFFKKIKQEFPMKL